MKLAAPDSKNPPRRRIGAVVLIFDPEGRVLLVKPSYKEGYILPGGGVLKDEFAGDAAVRHVRIETGLNVTVSHVVAVDQVPFNPANEHQEGFNYVYDGGSVTAEEAEAVTKHDGSRGGIQASVWALPQELGDYCKPEQASRIRHGLTAMDNGYRLPAHGKPHVAA